MKADVLPTDFAPSRLDLPSWLPEPIAQRIRAKVTGFERKAGESANFDDVLWKQAVNIVRDHTTNLPIVCDRRMESVWRELSKRKSSGEFLHPARAPSVANPKERQDAAMLELFDAAFAYSSGQATTTTWGEIEQQCDRFIVKADALRTDAWMLLLQAPRGKYREYCQKLVAAAGVYEDYARELYAGSPEMVFERKGDDRARWVALTLVNKFRELFAQPMYGLTATITSIILDRKIAPRAVRQWCCGN